jgi:two-component system OmpR family sensor kinase
MVFLAEKYVLVGQAANGMAGFSPVGVQADGDDVVVSGDANLLLDAFSNLLKNAVEYNRPGGEVRVFTRALGGVAFVTVRDTGRGIAPGDLPHVFDRFYRTDHSRTRSGGGAGLGLAITKSVIENHGGAIACTSVLGEGTEFVVRLPLSPSDDGAETRAS